MGGVKIRTMKPVLVGSHVELVMHLPGGKRLLVPAQVLWAAVDPPELGQSVVMGLRYETLESEAAGQILAFVDSFAEA
jgi:Tfp pilus assembly protein PilZ